MINQYHNDNKDAKDNTKINVIINSHAPYNLFQLHLSQPERSRKRSELISVNQTSAPHIPEALLSLSASSESNQLVIPRNTSALVVTVGACFLDQLACALKGSHQSPDTIIQAYSCNPVISGSSQTLNAFLPCCFSCTQEPAV